MSRIFVIGAGPMMDGGARRVTAHAVRTWHFVSVLRRAGHEVSLAAISTNISPADPVERMVEPREKEGFPYENLDMRAGNMFAHLVERCAQCTPDCVVGVSPEPASLACRIGPTVPVWADLHGWVMAEAQVKAARDADDRILGHFWDQERPVLRRADRISTVSEAQKFALLGELATVGRLNRHNIEHDFVVSIPSSFDPAAQVEPTPNGAVARRIGDPGAFVILWNGGFNTWTDGQTLFDGLELAISANPSIHFVATGGPIPGHADSVYEAFRARVERSPNQSRYHLLGWVAAEEFPGFVAGSHLALIVDIPCVETWTGTRTRLLEAMAAGLPVVMTRGTELSLDLERAGVGWVVAPREPMALGETILQRARDRDETERMGRRAREFVVERYSIERTMAPVAEWAGEPAFAPDNAAKRGRPASLLDAEPNPVEAAARAIDGVENVPSLVEAGRRFEQLQSRRLWRWLLRLFPFSP